MDEIRKNKIFNIVVISLVVLVTLLAIASALRMKQSAENKPNNAATTTPTPSTASVTPMPSVSPTSSGVTDTPSVSPSQTVVPTSSGTANVKVYFSKNPTSLDDPTVVIAVDRSTARKDVGTFAIEQLIAGPQGQAESLNGLFTPLKLSGTSNCNGKDFTLSVDTAKKAKLQFCKSVQTAGVGDDARIKTTITATLKQFPTIENVVILTNQNHCFGDMSGLDQCLK